MKYIRTKDGIYEYNTNSIIEAVNDHLRNHSGNNLISQANTIEELCDCFVSVQTYKDEVVNFDVYYSHGRNDFRDWFSEEIAEKQTIYGSIHIKNKGLIYVAKMNDKGELELL